MKKFFRRIALKLLSPKYVDFIRNQYSISSGPFIGMKYINESTGSSFAPKVLGTYEKELQPIVNEIFTLPFARILDIGAAEGYYAVGLAFAHPSQPEIIAFESNAQGRNMILKLANLNNVDSITVNGFCDVPSLRATSGESNVSPVLIICDIEGYEAKLLGPDIVSSLRETYILVEVHDRVEQNIGKLLTKRFQESHHIEEIWSQTRNLTDLANPGKLAWLLPEGICLRAMNEYRRKPMRWFWMKPRGNH